MDTITDELPLSGSLKGIERPEALPGVTYKIKVPNGQNEIVNVYVTINDFNGRTFEVFINTSDRQCYGRLSLGMIAISRMLRSDVEPGVIVSDFMEVSDPATGHMVKGFYCNSLEARVGYTLKQHFEAGGVAGLYPALMQQQVKVKK